MGEEQASEAMDGVPREWPLVTVAIPTYNRLSLLRRALASAQAQDYPNLEIIVSDNASTDGTAEFCTEVTARDGRVRYFRLPANLGHEANFRASFEQVRGPLFTWLADDDWLDTSYVSRCTKELLTRPEHVLVCGEAIYYEGDRPVSPREPEMNLLSESREERVLEHYRLVVRNAALLGVMRCECIASDPFPPVFGGDWLLLARLAFQGKVRTLPDVHLHRSLGGASADMAGLATGLGASQLLARTPNLVIGTNATADVLRASAYAGAPRSARILLAGRVLSVFWRRFYLPHLSRRGQALFRGGLRRLRGLPRT